MTDEVLEVGPQLGEKRITEEEALRAFRELKRRKVPLSEIARQIGYRRSTVDNCIKAGRFGRTMLARMSWLLRALIDGRLVPVKTGKQGRGVAFLPARKARKQYDIIERLERCVCGQYAKCPCLAHKPQYMVKKPCRPLRLDAVAIVADMSTHRRQLSQNARDAAPLGVSGSLSPLRSGRWPKG